MSKTYKCEMSSGVCSVIVTTTLLKAKNIAKKMLNLTAESYIKVYDPDETESFTELASMNASGHTSKAYHLLFNCNDGLVRKWTRVAGVYDPDR